MPKRLIIKPNAYYDSVSLMAITQRVTELPGVTNCVVAMGTAMNKELLQNVGLLTEAAAAATAADLVIAVATESEAVLDTVLAQAEDLLKRRATAAAPGAGAVVPRTIPSAVRSVAGANLALISVPGAYAAREARLALENDLHVMLYSDNVSVADELALKRLAHEKGQLLMGPDCGTAIINGVGLGFSNGVRRGPIGIVAASGTGAQEISTLIDRMGSGVSQLIGTGGRDLSEAIGGIMVLDGIAMLQADPNTNVIAVISKPPAPVVAERVLHSLQAGSKPYVVCLLGAPGSPSIDEAAARAVALATGAAEQVLLAGLGHGQPAQVLPVGAGRRFVRGLFSGGTLCDQALMVLEPAIGPVLCNVHPNPERRGGSRRSKGHTLVDLGDDEFTLGQPHPMIDPGLRSRRLVEEAQDPEVAVILLDVVIGHGSHVDPAGALAEAIRGAVSAGIAVVAAVTGTEADPQRYSDQTAKLLAAGAAVLPTARLAAMTAAATVQSASAAQGR